jgi:hypothetical protein
MRSPCCARATSGHGGAQCESHVVFLSGNSAAGATLAREDANACTIDPRQAAGLGGNHHHRLPLRGFGGLMVRHRHARDDGNWRRRTGARHCRGTMAYQRWTRISYSCSRTARRLRCSSLRLNVFTANASAAFWSGASIVPRLWARWRKIETRHLRSLAAVGFFFGDRVPLHSGRGADCESAACVKAQHFAEINLTGFAPVASHARRCAGCGKLRIGWLGFLPKPSRRAARKTPRHGGQRWRGFSFAQSAFGGSLYASFGHTSSISSRNESLTTTLNISRGSVYYLAWPVRRRISRSCLASYPSGVGDSLPHVCVGLQIPRFQKSK